MKLHHRFPSGYHSITRNFLCISNPVLHIFLFWWCRLWSLLTSTRPFSTQGWVSAVKTSRGTFFHVPSRNRTWDIWRAKIEWYTLATDADECDYNGRYLLEKSTGSLCLLLSTYNAECMFTICWYVYVIHIHTIVQHLLFRNVYYVSTILFSCFFVYIVHFILHPSHFS